MNIKKTHVFNNFSNQISPLWLCPFSLWLLVQQSTLFLRFYFISLSLAWQPTPLKEKAEIADGWSCGAQYCTLCVGKRSNIARFHTHYLFVSVPLKFATPNFLPFSCLVNCVHCRAESLRHWVSDFVYFCLEWSVYLQILTLHS